MLNTSFLRCYNAGVSLLQHGYSLQCSKHVSVLSQNRPPLTTAIRWMSSKKNKSETSKDVPESKISKTIKKVATTSSSKPPLKPIDKPVKRVSHRLLKIWKNKSKKIVMMTAYSYPLAVHADRAGVDMILVGDSVGMVEHGHETTQPVELDDMIMHTKAVMRGAKRPFVVADMPFGTYEISREQAMQNAIRIIKETGVQAVKLEGGKRISKQIKGIVDAGIAVVGHTGLTPQSFSALGGFRSMGNTVEEGVQVIEDALAIQNAGACACVLECIPSELAEVITQILDIPTIGIGAGPHTDGQVLVVNDLVGMLQHPQHEAVTPKFVKKFGSVGLDMNQAIHAYVSEVQNEEFPGPDHTPYHMSEKTLHEVKNLHSLANELHLREDGDCSEYEVLSDFEEVDGPPNEKIY